MYDYLENLEENGEQEEVILNDFNYLNKGYSSTKETINKANIFKMAIDNGDIDRHGFEVSDLKRIFGEEVDKDMLEPLWVYLSMNNDITGEALHLEENEFRCYGSISTYLLITESEWEDRERKSGRL